MTDDAKWFNLYENVVSSIGVRNKKVSFSQNYQTGCTAQIVSYSVGTGGC
jgi:hypothetical protein